ncbi:MAG: FCD domain-containing protein, partial [Lentihominibacter sp.]|nr:FCD domain-containing protein [Lentihominibacter sp.]
ETLGIGRNSTREALRTLENMGVISSKQGSGNFVTGDMTSVLPGMLEMMMVLSRFDKEELHSFRHNMEKTVCSMILQSGDRAKEIARKALRILNEAAVSAEDEIDIDMRFHFALVEGTGHRLMISLMQSASEISTDMISQVLSSADEEKKNRLFKAHEEIAKALEAGDEAKCFKAIDEHYNIIEENGL